MADQKYKNVAPHPVTLDDGSSVAPGESCTLKKDPTEAHRTSQERAAVEAGHLVPETQAEKPKTAKTSGGS